MALGFGPSDSSGTDDDLPPLHQNRDVRGGHPSQSERIAAISSLQYAQSIQDMETQIHQLEQEAYSSILRAFKAQADVITWEKETLMTEIRNELRVTDGEHRILLSRVNSDDLIRKIREWRQAGGGQTGFFGNGQHVHDSAPSLTVPASYMNPKASRSIPYMSLGGPLPVPALHTQTVAAPSHPYSSTAKRGSSSGVKGKKSKTDTRPVETASSDPHHPLIGKKVRTRWPADNNFYEAFITDYNPVEDLHALVYDVNTKDETWEWINLKEISPNDIMWESEDPCITGQGKNGAPVCGSTKTMKSGGLQGGSRGRRSMENYPENNFTSSQNGTKKKGSDDIEILDTTTLLNEVEKIFSSSCPDTMQIENAKRALKDQEHSLIDAIKRLADASDR